MEQSDILDHGVSGIWKCLGLGLGVLRQILTFSPKPTRFAHSLLHFKFLVLHFTFKKYFK